MTIYLDYNASAPLRPEVLEIMAEHLALFGNASSVHGPGRQARAAVEQARGEVAALVGARAQDVTFTSGGTESNVMALRGFPGRSLLVSAIEHDCVLAQAPEGNRLPVKMTGVLDLAALAERLKTETRPVLVSVMHANNETGVIQPIHEISALVHEAGGLLHCDAAQSAGKIPVSMEELGCDLLTLSAHKFGGPQGAGALVVRPGLELAPLLTGGGQERRRRAGTENVSAIAGFGRAAALSLAELQSPDGAPAHWAAWRDRLEERLKADWPDLAVFGADAPRLPSTSCFALPGVKADTALMALDLEGFALSSGAACSSGKVAPSHVLAAMGVPPDLARGALRLSFGWGSREEELDAFRAAWRKIASRLTKASAA